MKCHIMENLVINCLRLLLLEIDYLIMRIYQDEVSHHGELSDKLSDVITTGNGLSHNENIPG